MSRNNLKRVSFTLHDYTLADVKRLWEIDSVYTILGYEVCPNTKRRHIQGFINLTKKAKFNTVKKLLGDKCHVELSRGDDKSNQLYCSKDGDFIERGEVQYAGKRNDIGDAIATLKSSQGDLKRVAEDHPAAYVRYHRGFHAYRDLCCPAPDRAHKTDLHVFIGEPGAGKSRAAAERASEGERAVYYKPRGEWWDGYRQQAAVVIDDFYGWLKYDDLLKICDRYPYRVPIKGGYEVFNSKVIFITSNVDIDKWYKFEGYSPEAIYRRVTSLRRFARVGGFTETDRARELNVEINF